MPPACQARPYAVSGPMPFRLDASRLTLRTWEDRDRRPFAELSADAEVMRHLTPLPTRDAADAWVDRQRAQFTQYGFGYWAVELHDTRQLIRAVGLSRPSFEAHFTPAVGVGWSFAQLYWESGYASEAAAAALRFGVEELGLEETAAVSIPANIRSQQVMKRLGMTYSPADDFDHPRLPEGDPRRRCVLFRLSRQLWSRSRPESPSHR
jgi:RimJ/RimL family protein N-acetyltransferase